MPLERSLLEERHCNLPTAILPGDYLSLDLWYDIIDILFACNAVMHTKQRNQPHNYKVVCVDMTWIGSGDVFPRNSSADGCCIAESYSIGRSANSRWGNIFL